MIGAGPLEFYTDPGKTGLELSALHPHRTSSTRRKGFRVVSGEGGRPFGLERYGKAFYVAWHYKHRAALGDAEGTLREPRGEGRHHRPVRRARLVGGQQAEHRLSDARHGRRAGRSCRRPRGRRRRDGRRRAPAATRSTKALTTWPSWFFARGDLAAGGAGDESPLVFDDTTLNAAPTRAYTYPLGPRARPRPRRRPRRRARRRST